MSKQIAYIIRRRKKDRYRKRKKLTRLKDKYRRIGAHVQ